MSFPSFTDDCKYLKIHYVDNIKNHLGSSLDDYENYFTVRMLMLLESKCLLGQSHYDDIKSELLQIYYRDYHDHPQTFRPTFLLNDISRFWKTLLLNYENSRHELGVNLEHEVDPVRRIKAKVKNFKLKYSRMTTCFATIAAIGMHRPPVKHEQLLAIMSKTPQERLIEIKTQHDELAPKIDDLRERYASFLNYTALSTEELHERFDDKTMRQSLFNGAEEYRRAMLDLLENVGKIGRATLPDQRGLIDTLII